MNDPRMEDVSLPPFLKWAGGKRWLVCNYSDIFPTNFNRYFEPFLGAGSVFFHLRPHSAVLSDINPDLIETYLGIQRDWRGLQNSLQYRQRAHLANSDYYYRTRSKAPIDCTQRASRLIYLNRTCFNGIYRVNRDGQFNVPRGSRDDVVRRSDNFEEMSKLLTRAHIRVSDFEPTIAESREGDLVFADPPYTVLHNYNGFIKYNEVLFSWPDQKRLAQALKEAAKRGAIIVCTNANHESIRSLYEAPEFKLTVVSRFSGISADNSSRKYSDELIIRANT